MRKTYTPRPTDEGAEKHWFVVDATGEALGRISSHVARLLMGKHKTSYAPHFDVGDFVIVVNADQVVLTGRKEDQKVYYRHSGQPGKMHRETAGQLRKRRPVKIVEEAVKGMLPKNKLGRQQLRKLKVYGGPDHPHAAQKPTQLKGASLVTGIVSSAAQA